MRFLLLAILTTSCVTAYGPMGYAGGYKDRKLDEGEHEIFVSGNAYTDSWTLESYFHRRAKELCATYGMKHYWWKMRPKAHEGAKGASAYRDYWGNVHVTETRGPTKYSVQGVIRCTNEEKGNRVNPDEVSL